MFSNPFFELTGHIPPIVMQIYVIVMAILVAGGTILDTLHKKSAQYFFENTEKKQASLEKENERLKKMIGELTVELKKTEEWLK